MFVNVQEMQATEHFDVPDLEWLIITIEPGWFIKVSSHDERYWVQVTALSELGIMGRVANELVNAPFQHGEAVMVGYENVYDIAAEAGEDEYEDLDNIELVHAHCNRITKGNFYEGVPDRPGKKITH